MEWGIGLSISRNARSPGYFVRACVALLDTHYLRVRGIRLASNRLIFSASSFFSTQEASGVGLALFSTCGFRRGAEQPDSDHVQSTRSQT